MQEHPIEPWCLYAHFQSTNDTYGHSYTLVSHMNSIEDWARTWNNCHPYLVGDSSRTVYIEKKCVMSWSLFKHPIRPEWEHPANVNGITLTHRTNINELDAADMWQTLVVECARGAAPDYINGVQTTMKFSKTFTFIKFDVWLAPHTSVSSATQFLLSITSLPFTVSDRESRRRGA